MKKILFSLILALVTLGANAQGFGGRQFNPEDMAKRQVDRIKESCGINDEQYKKIYDYYLDQSKKQMAMMDSIRNAGGGQGGFPRMNREDMEKRQKAQNEAIKAILTEEQYAKYEEMQKQMRERFGQGRRNRQQ